MIEKDNIVVETFPLGSFACNCSLVYNKQTKECIAIDPGNDYSSFMELVRSRELKLKKLIHTHAHFDHIGRSKEIKDATGADIYLHQSDEQLYNSLKQQAMFFGEDVGETGVVDHFLNDEEELYLDNQSSQNKKKSFFKLINDKSKRVSTFRSGKINNWKIFFDEEITNKFEEGLPGPIEHILKK